MNKRPIYIALFSVGLFSALLMYSCRSDNKEDMIDCSVTLPASVSYSRDIQPLFDQHCNGGACHSGTNPAGNLNLDAANSYAELMEPGSGYVDTIRPTRSVLYAQMNSTSNPMPPDGRLNKCQIELVLKWIEQKAKNN